MRILVADDFVPWRRVISSLAQKQPGWHVICEVADGEEAVKRAQDLTPDLILLDVGLPKLNGIEAARRIRQLAPNAKILFVSAHGSLDVVEEALSTGASGYILKGSTASELLPAVDAIFQGRPFVSSRLSRRMAAAAEKAATFPGFSPNEVRSRMSTLAPSHTPETIRRHEAQFCSDATSLLKGFSDFIQTALHRGNSTVVVTTEPHGDSLLRKLRAEGLDMTAAIREGRYVWLNAAEVLARIMVDTRPDPLRFLNTVDNLFTSAANAAKSTPARVAACGECAALLWAQGNAEAAIRLEQLWNLISEACDTEVLCGYRLTKLESEEDQQVFQRICAEHSAVHLR